MDFPPSRPLIGPAARGSLRVRSAREQLAIAMRALGRAERSLFALTVPAWVVAGATALLGVYALVLYFHADLTLAQGDAIGHVYVARRVIDSATPSFAQFGYVWLPLPHLLMLPLIWNDTMWHTGLAGSVVSMLAFVGAAVYIHRTVRTLTGSALAGFVTAALFATNPNLLFIQATPMEVWCNGSSGVGTFLIRLWRATGQDRFRELAEEAARAVWTLRASGSPANCHGLAGNARQRAAKGVTPNQRPARDVVGQRRIGVPVCL